MATRFHIMIKKGIFIVLTLVFFPALGFSEGVLEGVASVIGASTPIFIAASAANSAKFAAENAAASNLYQTQTAADVARYQADNIRDTTLFQTFVSAQVAESNNKYATQRLQMQLNEMHDSFQQNLNMSRDQFRTEMNYKYQKLALDAKQADLQLELERMKAKSARVEAGISSGFNDVGQKVATNGSVTGATGAGTTEIGRAMKDPALRLLNKAGKVSNDNALKTGFLARNIASGSTRVRRNMVSDLSAFKSTLGTGRSFAGDAELIQHSKREASSTIPFRVHGQGSR